MLLGYMKFGMFWGFTLHVVIRLNLMCLLESINLVVCFWLLLYLVLETVLVKYH